MLKLHSIVVEQKCIDLILISVWNLTDCVMKNQDCFIYILCHIVLNRKMCYVQNALLIVLTVPLLSSAPDQTQQVCSGHDP